MKLNQCINHGCWVRRASWGEERKWKFLQSDGTIERYDLSKEDLEANDWRVRKVSPDGELVPVKEQEPEELTEDEAQQSDEPQEEKKSLASDVDGESLEETEESSESGGEY